MSEWRKGGPNIFNKLYSILMQLREQLELRIKQEEQKQVQIKEVLNDRNVETLRSGNSVSD